MSPSISDMRRAMDVAGFDHRGMSKKSEFEDVFHVDASPGVGTGALKRCSIFAGALERRGLVARGAARAWCCASRR